MQRTCFIILKKLTHFMILKLGLHVGIPFLFVASIATLMCNVSTTNKQIGIEMCELGSYDHFVKLKMN